MNPSVVPFFLIAAIGSAAHAQIADDSPNKSKFSYGQKGLQYESIDGNNFLWFGVRLQMRYANSAIRQDEIPGDPVNRDSDLAINRGRLKLGGNLVSPKFTVYSEYDFTSDTLLDLRATYAFSDWLNLRVGQWKSDYNRERIDSSGAQQFVERSIATPWFTIDRQKGVMASGRVGKGKAFDSSFWAGRLSGAGRGGDLSDADGFWMARYQWNVSGRVLGFSQSDIGKREKGAGSVALGFVDGKSGYTSFSGQGGGELPGFAVGESDQYAIRQLLLETAWQSHGFSWQQEFHWKRVIDRISGSEQKLSGGYMQAGMFFSEIWPTVPEPLEFAVRYANVDIDRSISGDIDREYTLAANWFFHGHRNKLTADLSYVLRRMAPENDTRIRLRIQWDVSF